MDEKLMLRAHWNASESCDVIIKRCRFCKIKVLCAYENIKCAYENLL